VRSKSPHHVCPFLARCRVVQIRVRRTSSATSTRSVNRLVSSRLSDANPGSQIFPSSSSLSQRLNQLGIILEVVGDMESPKTLFDLPFSVGSPFRNESDACSPLLYHFVADLFSFTPSPQVFLFASPRDRRARVVCTQFSSPSVAFVHRLASASSAFSYSRISKSTSSTSALDT
jgi:hypothetical protein